MDASDWGWFALSSFGSYEIPPSVLCSACWCTEGLPGFQRCRSPLNIAQIVACVGQQNVEGSRIRRVWQRFSKPGGLGPLKACFVNGAM